MKWTAALAAGEVQVWLAHADAGLMETCQRLLNPEERARMGRMRLGIARHEFIMGRALLRTMLGGLLGLEPFAVKLETGEFGKPFVEGLHFSVAHSHGLIAMALCREAAIGVDVEWMDHGIEALEIARASFSKAEVEAVEQAVEAERVMEFYRIWTRKESVVKAHGQGLQIALDSFDVIKGNKVDLQFGAMRERYFLSEFTAGTGFAGAVAVAEKQLPVRVALVDPVVLQD
jgi:4'-phosphopantetheinyl transferase